MDIKNKLIYLDGEQIKNGDKIFYLKVPKYIEMNESLFFQTEFTVNDLKHFTDYYICSSFLEKMKIDDKNFIEYRIDEQGNLIYNPLKDDYYEELIFKKSLKGINLLKEKVHQLYKLNKKKRQDYIKQKEFLFDKFKDVETKDIIKEMGYFKDGFYNYYIPSYWHRLENYKDFNKRKIIKEILSTREHILSKKQRKIKRREMSQKGK